MTNLYGQNELVYPKSGQVLTDTEVQFEWSLRNNITNYTIEVSTNTTFSTVNFSQTIINGNVVTSSPLSENETYFWRVQYDGGGHSPIRSFIIINYATHPDVEFWLDPSDVLLNSGNRVESWIDQKGNHNFSQGVIAEMPYHVASTPLLNSMPSVEFRSNETNFLKGVDLSVLTEGEIIGVFKNTDYPSINAGNSGIWRFGTDPSSDHYTWTDGNLYIGFGRSVRFNIGNHSTIIDFTLPHITNIICSNQFLFNVNKSNLFSTTTGLTSFSDDCLIGQSANPSYNYSGLMGDVILFNKELTIDEREIAHNFIKDKYTTPLNLGANITQYGYCDTTLYAGKRFDSYLWQDGSTSDSLVVTESGTYWVEVTDIFGFTSTDTIQVIFPEPDMPSNQLYCPGDSISWHTNLGPNYNYLWSDGSTADSLSINAPGDYHVQITDTNGCVFQSDTLYFDADPFETIVDLGADVDLCSGNSIGLIAGDTEAVDYLWNTGETDSTIIVNTTGTYYIDVVNANGCEASDTIDVTIIGDAPTVIPAISTTVCQNEEISYQDQSTTSDGSNIISWNWDFGDGGLATDEQGSYSYTNNGAFNVSLSVETSAGCFNDTTVSITVNEQPMLDFSTVNYCQETVINFNAGQLTPTTINTWQWNFDDPSSGTDNQGSGQNTTHIFESSGDYDVQLIGTDLNGCSDTVVETITIAPVPQVDFSFEEVCVGGLIEFENLSTIASGSISGYNWSFGDGTFSGQQEPQKLYSNHGTYSVTLNATGNNGCSDQQTQPLKIHAFPIVGQDINSTCAGITSVFDDASFVPAGSIAEVYWSLNGTSPLNGFNVEYVFENSGSQTIDQTVVSAFGCSSSESYTIQIGDYISADFEIQPTALLAGIPISFNNLSVGALTNEWIFGNLGTSTDVNPEFTFSETAVGDEVTIELKIENSFSCRDSVSLTLPVLSPRTDLAIAQLFLQEDNGFYVVGVELENKGTTPITSSDLFLRTPSADVIKEVWEGELQAGEKEIYIFSASPSMTVPQSQMDQNYVCVEAKIRTPLQFKDEDLSNNDNCQAVSESSGVLVVPHPNPVENDLNIQLVLPFDEVGTLKIYNAQGQIVAVIREESSFKKGLNSFKVNTELWQSGNYSIVYNGESEQQIAKVIKL